jgi:hypothetical protein
MTTLDKIKASIFLMIICGFFYFLTDSLFSEYEKRKKYYRIEFNSGRIYWADSLRVISENQISFFDVHSKRNVRMYGQFTISTPKK